MPMIINCVNCRTALKMGAAGTTLVHRDPSSGCEEPEPTYMSVVSHKQLYFSPFHRNHVPNCPLCPMVESGIIAGSINDENEEF